MKRSYEQPRFSCVTLTSEDIMTLSWIEKLTDWDGVDISEREWIPSPDKIS